MRSKNAGALVWRIGLGPRRLEPAHDGSRRLKHLRVLVEVRCTADRPHELGYVYKLPGDVVPKVLEHLPFLHGDLLFVSTDSKRMEPGWSWTHEGEEKIDDGDLGVQKARRAKVATLGNGRQVLPKGVGRNWTPLVDLLDFQPDDDGEHAALESRCRCGARPPADRHELIALAREALADGKTRRVFL